MKKSKFMEEQITTDVSSSRFEKLDAMYRRS